MAVRIGDVRLTALQDIRTEEARTLVEQRAPEQQGSVFQDLGREPVTVVLDGFLYGPDALSDMEKLRGAQAKAKPLPFAADIAVGSEMTEVVIESFRVRQIAGYLDRYRFLMRLKEHIEPPQPAGAALAPVAAGAQADAAAWGGNSLAAAGVLQNPASLAAALDSNPQLLSTLDMGDLAGAVTRNMDGLSAGNLDTMVSALANADPVKADTLFGKLRDAGSLGGMIEKYVREGIAFARGIDPAKLVGLAKAFAGGLDFLQKLKAVADRAGTLANDIRQLELPPGITALRDKGQG